MFELTYISFDPRTSLISLIGYSWDRDGDGVDESCVSFTYPSGENKGDICYVPMFQPSEVRTGELPYMPFIEVTLVDAPGRVHNVQGNVRYDEVYIDMNIYASNTDEIDVVETWMKKCKNELIDRVMTYRHSTTSCAFIEPIDTGREIIESTGQKVVFHNVISLYGYWIH